LQDVSSWHILYICKVELKSCIRFVCALAADNISRPRLFRSYTGRSGATNCTIVEAVLMTLASPGIIDPINIDDDGIEAKYMDSSLGFNNPTQIALQEASDLFGPDRGLSSIISFGTGNGTISLSPHIPGAGPMDQLIEKLRNISQQCEPTHQELLQRTEDLGVYFRFNPERNLEPSQLMEWSHRSLIKVHTETYFAEFSPSQLLNRALKSIILPETKVTLERISNYILQE
jgi:hypothetical protein